MAFVLTMNLRILLSLAGLALVVGAKQQSVSEIKAKYASAVEDIVQYTTVAASGASFEKLGEFCDKWGHRLQGSDVLEASILDHAATLESEGFDVSLEPCPTCPHWVRGEESVQMLEPLVAGEEYELRMTGLGRSVGTGAEGITAEVIIVKDFADLDARCDEARGKIVVWNLGGWVSYGGNQPYRTQGASAAATCGGLVSLSRSVGPYSLETPHTGSMTYEDGIDEIPAAAITIEGAELLQRISDRGQNITLRVTMGATNFEPRLSNNIIADWAHPEATKPDEVVFMSGHIDSWDMPGSTGAMDDGQGWATGWQAVNNIRALVDAGVLPPPKRTLRVAHWAAEEWGSQGASDYWMSEVQDESKVSLGMGDDNGAFTPTSFAFTGSTEARVVIQSIVDMLADSGINVTLTVGGGFEGSGLVPLIPRGTVNNDGGNTVWDPNEFSRTGKETFRINYFTYHHTSADTMAMMDKNDMDLNTAMYAALAYVVADLDEMLPRRLSKNMGPGSVECINGNYPGDDAPWGVTAELCGCSTAGNPADKRLPGALPYCESGWPAIENA